MTTMNKPPNETQKILAFVLANPLCTTREIAERMDLAHTFAAEALHRLARQGKVVREQANGVPPNFWRGANEDDVDGVPVRRRAVTTWKPHHHRDPLVAAMFGPAPIGA